MRQKYLYFMIKVPKIQNIIMYFKIRLKQNLKCFHNQFYLFYKNNEITVMKMMEKKINKQASK